jgi:hypothetical protein
LSPYLSHYPSRSLSFCKVGFFWLDLPTFVCQRAEGLFLRHNAFEKKIPKWVDKFWQFWWEIEWRKKLTTLIQTEDLITDSFVSLIDAFDAFYFVVWKHFYFTEREVGRRTNFLLLFLGKQGKQGSCIFFKVKTIIGSPAAWREGGWCIFAFAAKFKRSLYVENKRDRHLLKTSFCYKDI